MSNMAFNQYQKALEYAKTSIWEVMMPDGEIIITENIKSLLGYENTDFKEYHEFFDLIHPDDKPSAFKIIEDNLIGKINKHESEFRLKHKNRQYVWFRSIGGIVDNYENKRIYAGTLTDINERKLKNNEFQLIAENTSDGIMIYENGRIIYVSPAYKNLLGYSDEEEIGRSENAIMELVHPEDREHVRSAVYSTISEKKEYVKYQFRAKRKDGSYIWREDHARFIYVKNSNDFRAYVIAHDVSKEKEYENELKELSRLQMLLVEIASTFINLPLDQVSKVIDDTLAKMAESFNTDRVYIFDFNSSTKLCTNTYEWCREGIDPQIDFLHEVRLSDDWIKKFARGEHIIIPDVKKLPEGLTKYMLEPQGILSLLVVPMMYNDDCIGFVGFDYVNYYHTCSEKEIDLLKIFAELLVNLMNKRKRQIEIFAAKDKIEESDRMNRTLIDGSPIGIIHFEPNGNILAINKSLIEITGSPSEDATRQISLLESENVLKTGFVDDVKICIRDKRIVQGSSPFTSQWGKESYLKYYIAPVISGDRVSSLIANFEDITELIEARNDLIHAKEKAEESDELKTAFLQNLSHEIRTPLNGILGFTEILSDDDIDEETRMECKSYIQASSNRLLSLIENVISLSRIETGQMVTDPEYFDLQELFNDVYNFYNSIAKEKGLKLEVKHEIPECELQIFSDRKAAYGIITSLVDNAVKFTDSGKIEIGCSGIHYSDISIYVRDTGIGIEGEFIDKIYDKFFQIDHSITRKREGSGIGLSLAKGLAEYIGAEITVESKIDHGSTFYLNLPLNFSDTRQQLKKKNEQINLDFSSIKAIIAEDDEPNYVYLNMMLNRLGIKSSYVDNGKDLIKYLDDNNDIDLVMMDLKMPEMDGFEALKIIREMNRDVFVIAQTAFANPENIKKVKEFGFDGFLAKPINKQKLIELLNKIKKNDK
jgi:PAS domain S-box-containing protein